MSISCRFVPAWLQSHLTQPDRGVSLVVYALLVALTGAVRVAMTLLGQMASSKFSEVASAVS